MFTVPWFVVALYMVAYAIAGMAIGAITGCLVSLLTKGGRHGILKDAFLGSCGYLAGFVACIFTPWPRNSITYRLEGGTEVTSTMNRYQHPEVVAVIIAILLPLLHELYLWKKRNTASLT
jgi:hypothetical protein